MMASTFRYLCLPSFFFLVMLHNVARAEALQSRLGHNPCEYRELFGPIAWIEQQGLPSIVKDDAQK
jgi:hypothetical protein